jgi:hypothetical protein
MMRSDDPHTLYRYLYTSTMTDAEPGCIPRILRTAKHHNVRLHVTGLLIFDGQHFCHYLEGNRPTLDSLLQQIMLDSRHAEVHILAQGPLVSGRRFPDSPLAFALTHQPEALDVFAAFTERSAFDILESLLPTLDFGNVPLV